MLHINFDTAESLRYMSIAHVAGAVLKFISMPQDYLNVVSGPALSFKYFSVLLVTYFINVILFFVEKILSLK